MLIPRRTLERISTGEVDLAFRRWRRPTVRTGGTLRTAVGMLDIVAVDRVSIRAITASEAHRAGYGTRRQLVDELARRDGATYRIELRLGGEDPLVTLRTDDDLSPSDVEHISMRLASLDARSNTGSWTRDYLRLISERPHVRAEDLADSIGLDKPTFKARVRKLKALGLTVSHSPGYEVSPRGRAYLATEAP